MRSGKATYALAPALTLIILTKLDIFSANIINNLAVEIILLKKSFVCFCFN